MTNPLVRNIIRTFSTQVGCALIAIVSGIFVARLIGPESKGFISYASTAVSLVSVFFFGFSDAVLYQFGKLKHSARAVHAVTIRVLIATMIVIVPIFVIISMIAPSQHPLAAAAAAMPFAIYVQVITPFLMVRDNISLVNIRTITQSLGTALCTVALLYFTHLGLTAVLGVWIVFYAVAAMQTGAGVQPILKSSPNDNAAVAPLLGEQIRFGLRAASVSAVGFLNLRIDVFIVSIMLSAAELGWYTLAIASGELLWQVSRAFVWTAVGRIGSDSFQDAAALVARLTRNVLAIVGTLGLVAFVTGPWLIVHVYGKAFEPAGSALRWALPGLVAYAAEVALTKFMVLQLARPMAMVWIQSGGAALCATLTVLTAGHFGIVAAAASTSLSYLLVTIVLISMFARGTGISPQRLLFVQREDMTHYSGVIDSALRTLRLRSA